MKKLLTSLLLLLAPAFAFAQAAPAQEIARPDSVILHFGKNSKMIVLLANPQDLRDLRQTDFQAILDKVQAEIDRARTSGNNQFSYTDSLGTVNIRVVEEEEKTTLAIAQEEAEKNRPFEASLSFGEDSPVQWPFRSRRTEGVGHINVGFNQFLGDAASEEPWALRGWGSRYFELFGGYRTFLGGKDTYSGTFIEYGLSWSAFSFMFTGNDGLIDNAGMVQQVEWPYENVEKSKLAVHYFNIPFTLGFRSKDRFKFDVGGYAGFRIGSHMKVKYERGGDNETDKYGGNYNLNRFRYGLMGSIGYDDIHVFVQYDMNTLFEEGNASGLPEFNAISFGLRLF